MMHPATELRFISDEIGSGVVATSFIPRGTITWVRDDLDQAFSPEKFHSFAEPYRSILDRYAYLAGSGEFVLCWDHGRFVNHSCESTSLSAGWHDFEIAVRDIEPGSQLTDDYGTLNQPGGFDPCRCGSPSCRGKVFEDDLLRYADRWDALLAKAFPLIEKVEQPLWPLMRSKAEVEKVLRGEAPLPSVRLNYIIRTP